LWQAVHLSAVDVLDDPRFINDLVTARDLPNLELEITILSPLHAASSPLDFEPLQDGVYLTIGAHSGCFLPQVARETGWTRQELLDRLCSEKLGVCADAWQSQEALLQTFTSLIVGPEPVGLSELPIIGPPAHITI
jgi:AMMECR1 domain-containing protein